MKDYQLSHRDFKKNEQERSDKKNSAKRDNQKGQASRKQKTSSNIKLKKIFHRGKEK